ncbi:MAG: N-acetyltransferase family protein [Actinomycetota bacterium]
MNIRRIHPGEGPLLKDIRLRALLTDPDAFGASYGRDATHDDDHWENRARGAASGNEQFIALAEDDGRVVGMIGAYTPEDASHVRHLVSTWVAPEARGNGLGIGLVGAVVEWTRRVGASEVTLWVVDENRPAIALYEGAGFVPTGDKQPLPSNPSLIESLMTLSLS